MEIPRETSTWGSLKMITQDGKEHILTIENNRLFFDGKPIMTEQKIKLGWLVNVAIVLASIATAAMAVFTVIDLWPW